MHAAAAQGDKVACTRCGTTRQAHIQLHLQKCPVRGFFRGGAEDPAGTEMYAAWHRTVRAMHAFAKEAGAAEPAAALAAAPPAAAVAAMADEHLVAEPAVPRPFVLRPFRSHVMAKCASVEFCMQCCMQPPLSLGESLESRMLRWQDPDRGLPAVHLGISVVVPGQLAPRGTRPEATNLLSPRGP